MPIILYTCKCDSTVWTVSDYRPLISQLTSNTDGAAMKFVRHPALSFLTALVMALPAFGSELKSSIDPTSLPAHKLTTTAKYLSSMDVYHLIMAEPAILFIDVRDPIEIAQQGHPENIDAVVPVRIQGFETRAAPQNGALEQNPDFLKRMEDVIVAHQKSRHDLIILTCGSGRRSAEAAQILSDAGFTNVYHVPDGYEGDEATGYNTQNAWELAGLPWSMKLAEATEWTLEISYESQD